MAASRVPCQKLRNLLLFHPYHRATIFLLLTIIAILGLCLINLKDIPLVNDASLKYDHDNIQKIRLATPEEAAAHLKDSKWLKQLRVRHVKNALFSKVRSSRIVEWTHYSSDFHNADGIDLLLMPFSQRSTELIELFLNGHVFSTMGENIVMLGWAKVALALGCRRVLMFESMNDFIDHINIERNQVYLLDYLSLPQLKDRLLLNDVLRKRTWEFAWWGRSEKEVHSVLNISDEYGFRTDHAIVPFNYSSVPAENVRVPIIPTALALNHIRKSSQYEFCDAFFMGKSITNVENLIPIISHVEERLSEMHISPESIKLCTGFHIPKATTFELVLGFQPRFTTNLNMMKPRQFANLVGSAKIVIGSGTPICSPTIVDTIYGGGVFMAPSTQFCSIEMHPLFVKTDEAFDNMEEQVNYIVEILLSERKNHEDFGSYNNTSYSVNHTCHQLLSVIYNSFPKETIEFKS